MISFILYRVFVSLLVPAEEHAFEVKEKLSEYQFFQGPLSGLTPAPGVYPYGVNNALFSNYAEKLRFFRLPAGGKILYRDSGVFDFPKGSVLIKNFYYPRDFRKPEKGRILLETRLLVHEEEGWEAYLYIWNDDQTEAYYDPAGETREVKYISASGKRITTPYIIPNKNQCKGCHLNNNALVPIGPSARQLNMKAEAGASMGNQLQFWKGQGLIVNLPEASSIPAPVVWNDAASGSLNDRARAYLDANCGHCHSRTGPANTSGLYLGIYERDNAHLGVNKSPVAAGRGSGNLRFDIVPGSPDRSILIYRMRTNDPSIAMPEIGREQIHDEGVALIEEWIRNYAFTSPE